MSDFSAHEALEQAQERSEHSRGNPTVAIAAALLAVLAALSTMFAHSRSTTGLVEKNEAILAQARASDKYNYYEAKQIKFHLYNALLDAGLGDQAARARMLAKATSEQTKSKPILKQAQTLEAQAEERQLHSESALHAYETFEIAVTLFEVSIVFVSISALAGSSALIVIAGVSSSIGIVFLILGFLRH
ncbi:MAG: DUF4337 domain-containing protein [Candidatus Eremiobacteraeota bacterium]|nr:DUF4337 domain-containing protein [Candidatus Eremiobacteraeota bacterium]